MKNICTLPWVGFSNDPNGTVRPCCINKEHITDTDGKPFFIQRDSVEKIFHSEYMENLRKDFLEGKKPLSCSTCWKDEDNGYKSKRQIYAEIHKDHIEEKGFDTTPKYPIDYQLILTNACNLKCRSCGTSHSTSWQKEIKTMDKSDSDLINQFSYDLPFKQPGDVNSVFLKDIDSWAPNIKRMEVVGGEPFYTEVWEKVWKYLIEHGYSKNIELAMSTNCTKYNEPLLELLDKNFKAVGIGLSIDGTEDTFEYLRTNATWVDVKENILNYYRFFQRRTNTQTTFNFTYTTSWIDAYFLPEFHQWVKEYVPEFRIWNNIVHWPEHMSLTTIPKEVKDKIKDKWSKYDWGQYTTDIQALINHMYSVEYDREDLKKQYKKFTVLDKYRKQNTAELASKIFPEIKELF